ncbi:vesicle-associated membrane protein 4 isoform X1 [Nothobranchius furzeri]|uniref:vesicle-associated membrane protein 4 isoform X1 n=1 Tax=Nothobranchius furzeri TaxID=105023 RepID=UPI0039048175
MEQGETKKEGSSQMIESSDDTWSPNRETEVDSSSEEDETIEMDSGTDDSGDEDYTPYTHISGSIHTMKVDWVLEVLWHLDQRGQVHQREHQCLSSTMRNLLEEDSDEEEDFFLRGPTGPRFGPQSDKMKHVQSQVDEVIDVMQENISKVIERGERLDDLQDKSESLSDHASAFSSRAKQLHRRMWWRDMKMKIVVALVVVAILLIIIIPVILRYRN